MRKYLRLLFLATGIGIIFDLHSQDIQGIKQLFPDLPATKTNPGEEERKLTASAIQRILVQKSVDSMTDREVDDNLRNLGLSSQGTIYVKRERLREALVPELPPELTQESILSNQKKKDPPIQIQNAAEGQLLNIDKTQGGVLVLRGKVRLKIKGGELLADSVSIDSQRQEVYAEGGVEYKDGQAKITGERFLYDIKLNQGVVYNSKLSYYPSFFIGQKLKRLDEKRYLMEMGYFTACNAELPHDSFQAKKIIIYDDKSVIAYNLTFKVGGTPLFWLPVLYNSETGNGWMVQSGKNNTQGWFLQNSYQWSDPYPNSLLLANGYKIRFDMYEKTGQAAQLEMWKLSPNVNYNINLGYANYKKNTITSVYEDRFKNFGIGNVAVTNTVDRGELFPNTGLGFRNTGVDYDPWWKAELRLNVKSNDFNKDVTRNLQVGYENFSNRQFDYEFGNRYQPSNSVQSLYTYRDVRLGFIRNLLNWNLNYTENRGDLSVSIGLSRTLVYQIQADKYFSAQDTLPVVTIKNSSQVGNLPFYNSPVYWDLNFQSNISRLYGAPTQSKIPNTSITDPTGKYNDFVLRTQTSVYGESGFRSPISLGSYASFTPSIYAGATKQTAEYPGVGTAANSPDLDSNKAYSNFLKQQSYQYVRQSHTARIGVPELFFSTTYRKIDAQKAEIKDPILGNQRQHEAEFSLESYALNDIDISVRTIRDLRTLSPDYNPGISNMQRWYYTVVRVGGFIDFIDGFQTRRPSLLERKRNFYSGIFINNDYVHHTPQNRSLSNNLTVSYKMGGFSWPIIRAIRSLEVGSTWYHVYKDSYLDSYRFFFRTDTKITRYSGVELELDSRVTEPWRLTALAQGQFYAYSTTPELFTAQNGTNYDQTTIWEDLASGTGANGQDKRQKTVFNINRFMMTFKLDLHNWEYRLGYSMNLRALPGGLTADNTLTFYDQSVYFSVNLTNFSFGDSATSQATRVRLYRFRKRPLDGTSDGISAQAQ
ncbi:LPS-assembly protein LptD [Leptospira ognonensis]|uniref:LPS-assembly protein LptD n=1 Tax=Leptospira ognonensis TaxID=2484945 RepID=A0A4R9JYB8_9LEPT|nr:LPS-assembly protein LptD [Leptospira ognonensis]TGL57557.1 LPS-assembly protein LptD [Leptospira ognonensis]